MMEVSPFIGKPRLTLRAAEIGDIEIAEMLLDHDADIDAPNFQMQTPFHIVIPLIDL